MDSSLNIEPDTAPRKERRAAGRLRLSLAFFLAVLASASMWFYVDMILVGHQVADAAANRRPRGNLSDLYPRWLGARELLLHHRNPYGTDVTLEIQKGYYGRALDPARPNDPKDQQGFAYPVYIAFLLAPLLPLPFHDVQMVFHWLLVGLTAASVWLWLRVLRLRWPPAMLAIAVLLTLGSIPAVQGIKLQQLSLLVAALLAASAACVANDFLFCGGALLALATIKPQLALIPLAWMLLWTFTDWSKRRRFAVGFALIMAALLAGQKLSFRVGCVFFCKQWGNTIATQRMSLFLINWFPGRMRERRWRCSRFLPLQQCCGSCARPQLRLRDSPAPWP